MASPTVFISSTFYDLRYIRESLKRLVESIGYQVVMSESGTIFYDPNMNAAASCLAEVPNADLFVLIIGGRYGSILEDSGKSVTNGEYQEALRRRVPIFALVEQGTHSDYGLYRANSTRPELLSEITFPHADDTRVFAFIDEVQGQTINNALVPFRTFADVETYLRAQWAAMMHSFLTREAEERQVVDSLGMLTQVNSRIELLTEQILKSVGSKLDRATVVSLQHMLVSQAVSDLRYIGLTPTPADVIKYESFNDCTTRLGKEWSVENAGDQDDESLAISSVGDISPGRFHSSSRDYQSLRNRILAALAENDVSPEEFMRYELANQVGKFSAPR